MGLAGEEILSLTGADRLWFTWADEAEGTDCSESEGTDGIRFPLIAPGKNHQVATLWLQSFSFFDPGEN